MYAKWILLIILSLFSCAPEILPTTSEVFDYLHNSSESIYDGSGAWGETAYAYKMALRDSYWRADVYGFLSQQGGTSASLYSQRADAAVAYLLSAQSNGGTGVFGFPADADNPEFGATVAYIQANHPDMISNGWIISLPTNEVQQLYYDHGYALYTLCQAYIRTQNTNLIPGIKTAADWILDKPVTQNLNYLSSLSKGLCLAWSITSNTNYLLKAVWYHTNVILPGIGTDGQALDSHNAQLEYHGFIVSGLIALDQQLTNGHPLKNQINTALEKMVSRMAQRDMTDPGDWEQTWLGTNLQAWYELSLLRPLTTTEKAARDQCLLYIRSNLQDYRQLSGYAFRKSLYANFFIGYSL